MSIHTRVCLGLAPVQLARAMRRRKRRMDKKKRIGEFLVFFLFAFYIYTKLSSLWHYYIPREIRPTSDLINHGGQMNSTRVGNPLGNDQTSTLNVGLKSMRFCRILNKRKRKKLIPYATNLVIYLVTLRKIKGIDKNSKYSLKCKRTFFNTVECPR